MGKIGEGVERKTERQIQLPRAMELWQARPGSVTGDSR